MTTTPTKNHVNIGNTTIFLEYHPSPECIRGWSFRVAGYIPGIQFAEQYGYGSEADALEAGVLIIEELCKGRIRERERELTKLKELLQKSQAAQPPFGLSQADKQKWQHGLNQPIGITEITPDSNPDIWQLLQP